MQISARLFIFVYQRVRRLPVYSISRGQTFPWSLCLRHLRQCLHLPYPCRNQSSHHRRPRAAGSTQRAPFQRCESSCQSCLSASARGIYAGTSRGRGRGGNVRRLRQVRFNNPSFLKSLASHLFITSGFSVSLSLGFSQPTKLLELLP